LLSKDEPGQWICWDFGERLILPTHYTIWSGLLNSWVVESSLDGETWTEIDRKTDTRDLEKEPWRASFPVWKLATCRFIRVTQTSKNYRGADHLGITSFEFFGALIE
jgi:hypothetical protein